jgi:hypothetical protein
MAKKRKPWQEEGSVSARPHDPYVAFKINQGRKIPVEHPWDPLHEHADPDRPSDLELHPFEGNWVPVPPFKPTGVPGWSQRYALCLYLTLNPPPKVGSRQDYRVALGDVRRALLDKPPSWQQIADRMPDTSSKATAKDRVRRGLQKLGYSLPTRERFAADVRRVVSEEILRHASPEALAEIAQLARGLGLLP